VKAHVKPQRPISKDQFDKICSKYVVGNKLSRKDALRFLNHLADAVEVPYDEAVLPFI